MIIIDLFGLPGTGKSTIAKELYIEFKKREIDVYFFNKNEYLKDEKFEKRRLFDYIKLLKVKNIIFFIQFVLIKKEKDIFRQGMKEKIWKKLRLVMLYDKLTQKSDENKICIVDQGIIQDFSDYYININVKHEFVRKYLNCFLKSNNKYIYVYCDLEVENAIDRIKNRNRKLYNFDLLKEQELKIFLEKEYEKFKIFEDCLKDNENYLKIYSSNELVLENIKRIIEKCS